MLMENNLWKDVISCPHRYYWGRYQGNTVVVAAVPAFVVVTTVILPFLPG